MAATTKMTRENQKEGVAKTEGSHPEWKNTAILETELSDRDTVVKFPDFIKIVADVTGDKRYSNASMSRSFPEETAI